MKSWNHETLAKPRNHETMKPMEPWTFGTVKLWNLWHHETIKTYEDMKPWNRETYQTIETKKPWNLWNL